MGVFTVGRQVALEIDMPGWWLANASVDMDFRRGLYYDSSTANPRAATDFLSCTRASVGYATTSAGTLTQFAANALRITDKGLLVEDARMNEIGNSQTFDQTGGGGALDWLYSNLTITSNQAAAPDGTTTADKADEGTATSRHLIYTRPTTFAAGATVSFSIYVEDVDRRYVQLSIAGDSGGFVFCYADLQTGTISDSGTASVIAGTALTSATIEGAAGFYRIKLVGVVNNADTAVYHQICLSDRATQGGSLSSFCPSYTGTNKSVYLWGAQSEEASFVSSYIPTTGAAATRAADKVTCIGNLDTLLSALPHSDVIDATMSAAHSGSSWFMCADFTGSNDDLYSPSNDAQVAAKHSGAVLSANLGAGLCSTGVKAGVALAAGARSLVGNGGTVATDANAAAMSSTHIGLGCEGDTNFMYGYIRRATFWNSKLADATLQGFTV